MNWQARLCLAIPIESEDLDTTLAVVSHGFEVKLETGRKIERRRRRRRGRKGEAAARRAPREERQKEKAAAATFFPSEIRVRIRENAFLSIDREIRMRDPRGSVQFPPDPPFLSGPVTA
jgi:hypothetical protein